LRPQKKEKNDTLQSNVTWTVLTHHQNVLPPSVVSIVK